MGEAILIFVTVGTSNFPFPRLLKKIEELAKSGKIEDKIFIQKGQTPFALEGVEVFALVTPEKFKKLLSQADIVITHGGLVSIVQASKYGKHPPIVVPRQKKFGEHVDDHQLAFVQDLEKRGHIIAVYKIEELEKILLNFKKYASDLKPFSEDVKERERLVGNLVGFTEGR